MLPKPCWRETCLEDPGGWPIVRLGKRCEAIVGSLEAWTGMWEAEPAKRDGTGVSGTRASNPGPGYQSANILQGE